MVNLKFTSSVRDAIYGIVPITTIEQGIIKIPMMGRLKNIKQLGMAYLTFSGANHTRFEHSVGAMHIAYLMGQAIGLDDNELQAVRLAALLHDVGHPPFSHSIEFAFRMVGPPAINHADVTFDKINTDDRLKSILRSEIPLLHSEDLARIATGRHENKILTGIVDGPLDADKIDYILRDNYHCGFPVALDVNTVTEILEREKDRGIVLKPSGMTFAEQLYIGRYHLITKIHHDKLNRLSNYLLALALSDALDDVRTKEEDEKQYEKKMFYEWTDSEMLAFLERSKKYYSNLRSLILGDERLKEIGNFSYDELSPLGRYNASIICENISSLPHISKELSNCMGEKKVFLDAYWTNPPETTLSINVEPKILLVDTPLTKGVVEASLGEVHLGVYSFESIDKSDFDEKSIVDGYQKSLDPTFSKDKAKSIMEKWVKGDDELKLFYLRHLVEVLVNKEAIDIRSSKVTPSDILMVILYALYEVFNDKFSKRVYVDSLTQLALVYLEVIEKGALTDQEGKVLKPYNIIREEGELSYPTNLIVDIARLERIGLIHRLTRTIKAGERFRPKYQFRITGWGRGYYQRNLSYVASMSSLFQKLRVHFDSKISESKALYDEYFKLAEKASSDTKASQELNTVSRKLPIRVTN